MHKSGFVNILGRPNAGKSTLLNALLGERMVIVSPKPQTTRHRIFGIYNTDDYQIVFSDTPGIIDSPAYRMQEAMSGAIHQTFEDADLILYMVTPDASPAIHQAMFAKIARAEAPKFLILNKTDLIDTTVLESLLGEYRVLNIFREYFAISALQHTGTEALMTAIMQVLPEGPEYFPKDQLTDRPERFFVTEIIREKILEQYHQEIPYSCEVGIDEYKEGQGREANVTHIRATIYVNRKTQKPIIIGRQGEAIKQLGIASRKAIEQFIGSRVHLELFVKVRENWRDDERALKEFGYRN